MARTGFVRVDVTDWELGGPETDGGSEHEWLRDPGTRDLWLFKPNVVLVDREQGEDWAEKISSELCAELWVPAARVELAIRGTERGCISRNLLTSRWELQPGAVVLTGLVDNYESQTRYRRGHSLSNIQRALEGFAPPPDAQVPLTFTAFDVFVGYLVLDALIANRDRHDNNWAVLRPPTADPDRLCGSYDHASGLGFNLNDTQREKHLSSDHRFAKWVGAGTAYRFEHSAERAPSTLVALALEGLAIAGATVRSHWLSRIESLTDFVIDDIVQAAPDLSEVAVSFVGRLLKANRQRLLEGGVSA